MCKPNGPKKIKVVSLDFIQWQPMRRVSILDFSFRLMDFRVNFVNWMAKENYEMLPKQVWSIIMMTDYESFWHHEHGLSMKYFATITFFLFVNRAPMRLRQCFWGLFYTKPMFDENGLIGSEHPYFLVYDRFRMEGLSLVGTGAFHDLSLKMDRDSINYWMAFNVWGCRGVFNNHLNFRRVIVDDLRLVHATGDTIVILSWPGEEEEDMVS